MRKQQTGFGKNVTKSLMEKSRMSAKVIVRGQQARDKNEEGREMRCTFRKCIS
jgi:hypothetical protein